MRWPRAWAMTMPPPLLMTQNLLPCWLTTRSSPGCPACSRNSHTADVQGKFCGNTKEDKRNTSTPPCKTQEQGCQRRALATTCESRAAASISLIKTLKTRFNQVYTGASAHKYGHTYRQGENVPPNIAEISTVTHILGSCKHLSMPARYIASHNKAVVTIFEFSSAEPKP